MIISLYINILFFLFLFNQINAHAPDTLWTKIYGGMSDDYCRSVQQTTDEGYIIVGSTFSFGAGVGDVWLLRTESSGDTLWTKTFGGTNHDAGNSVQQTTDGGYIIAGSTRSYGAGNSDVYLIKTDATGDTLWTKTFGGADYDYGNSVQQTTDGGYIIAGSTPPLDAGGAGDIWLIKTDSSGDTLWTKTYGGIHTDFGYSVQQTIDGGYIIVGYTNSFGAGNDDVWIIRTNSSGDTLWTKTFGGSYYDEGRSVQQTTDGGYIVVGSTNSYGAGHYDIWLLRTDSSGDTLWTKTYGGIHQDFGYSVQQTTDGGYIVGGEMQTNSADTANVYLIKISSESGIEENQDNIVRNKQIVTIIFAGPLVLPEDRECIIFDIFGRQVLSEEISPGIYFIEIDGKINWKVVKFR